jgi:mono/diheme cytochrome c family protein
MRFQHGKENRVRKPVLLVLLLVALALTACGGNSTTAEEVTDAPSTGDAAAGQALFVQTLIGTQAGCTTCHSLEPDVVVVGPSLAGVATVAGSRVSGLSAAEYLRQSIMEPDAHVVDGFARGLMPAALATELSEQQLNDLVAYMLTLE